MKKLTWTILAVCAALMVASTSHVRAADDDEDVGYDTKILRGLMSGLGLKRDGVEKGIEYRERSPLVLPPSRDVLPPPMASDATPGVADWPVDQDVKRRREAAKERKKIGGQNYIPEDEARQLLPGQMTPGAKTAGRQPAAQSGRGKDSKETEPGDRLSASQLGYKGNLFTWGGLFGTQKEETVKFEGEPGRASLTDPPAGYRTPSAAQPYGVSPDSKKPKAMDYYDRQTPEEDRAKK